MGSFPYVATIIIASAFTITGCENNTVPGKPVTIKAGKFTSNEPSAVYRALNETKNCSLDTVNGKERSPESAWTVKRGERVKISGWAFSEDGKKVPAEVFLRLTGPVTTYYAVTTTRFMRNDANQHLSIDPSLAGGFELEAETAEVEPGIYEIAVLHPIPEAAEICEGRANLIVN